MDPSGTDGSEQPVAPNEHGGPRRKLSWRKKLAFMSLPILALLLLAIAAELTLRVAGWPVPGLDTAGASATWPIKRTGKEGGWFPPGVWRQRHYDYDTEWAVNKDGFRERERSPKSEGAYRVLVLGDSFTAGHGVELDKRFVDIWSRNLRTRHPNVEVWDLATGLSGTGNMADVVEGIGRKYEFDEVILGFFAGNDLDDNEDFLRLQKDPDYVTSAVREVGWSATLRNLRLLTYFNAKVGRKFKKFPPWGVYKEERFKELWPGTEACLDRLLKGTEGKPLTLWYIPTPWEWSDDAWQSAKADFGYSDEDRGRTKSAVLAWCEKNNVPVVDCSAFLKGSDPKSVHFEIDPHWNDLGNELVAKGLSAQTQAAAFLRDPSRLQQSGPAR